MSEQGVGLISVLQRIATALEDMDSILVELTVEVMDIHDIANEQLRITKLSLPRD